MQVILSSDNPFDREEELRLRIQQQAVVAELGQRALMRTALDVLLDEAVSLVAETLDVEYCKVLELLPDGSALRLRAGVGWHAGLVGVATVDAGVASQAGYTLLSDTPVMVDDLRAETRFSGPPLLHDHGVVSGISVIIRGNPQPFGVLGAHTTRQRRFTTHDTHFLQAVANVLGQAIAHQRAEAERAAEARFLQVQLEVARVGLSSLQPAVLLPQLLATICRAQGYTIGLLWRLVDSGRALEIVATYGESTAPFVGYRREVQDPVSPAAQALRAGKPVFLNQVMTSPRVMNPFTRAVQVQAIMALPLIGSTGEPIGVLSLGDIKDSERFTGRDLEQGLVLAHQVSQAFENSTLFSQIKQLQEQHRVVTDTLHDAVYVVDLEGRITFANPALATLTGYRLEELLGQPAVMLYASQALPEILKCRQQSTSQASVPPHLQVQMVRKDDQRVDVELSTANLLLGGQVVGQVTAARDVTARLQLEAQLRQSQRLQALGTLAGGIAHNFNNILGTVLGYAELTLDDVPQPSIARDNLQQILVAGERARDLVQQMLTFSHQTAQERQSIHLHLLVKEALALLRAALPATITLQHHLDEHAGTILADPAQLYQVLLHLCTNAAHAMHDTGRVLEIRLDAVECLSDVSLPHPDLTPGAYVRLSVRDTGHGMEPEVRERIFEPFFTTKDIGEGTGLGLAVVHGIITDHGGAITVDSIPGQGTTCTVYLPRSDRA
jgi:PAS domain S-box-containing protein